MRTAKSEPISPRLTGASGEMLSQISNRMVQLHKRYYGKGPTKARSYVMGDLVVCLMRGGFTRAEETLMGSGRAGLVHEQRSEFQEALRHESARAVSEIAGEEVFSFISNALYVPALIVEIFLLAPGADLET